MRRLRSFRRAGRKHLRLDDDDEEEPGLESQLIHRDAVERDPGAESRVAALVEEQHVLIQLLHEFRDARNSSTGELLTSASFSHLLSRLRASQEVQSELMLSVDSRLPGYHTMLQQSKHMLETLSQLTGPPTERQPVSDLCDDDRTDGDVAPQR
jgi:hypothetical protein